MNISPGRIYLVYISLIPVFLAKSIPSFKGTEGYLRMK